MIVWLAILCAALLGTNALQPVSLPPNFDSLDKAFFDIHRSAAPRNQSSEALSASEERLPGDLWPIHYELGLQVFVPGHVALPKERVWSFTGHLTLEFVVKRATDVLELNAVDLQVRIDPNNVTLRGEQLRAPKVKSVKMYAKTQKMVIQLTDKLSSGQAYTLHLPEYTGKINVGTMGLYQGNAYGRKGVATTQFEPIGARLMVPCFDEPEYKATWQLSVIHPFNTTAISNQKEMGKSETTKDKLWVKTSFKKTVKMSSYLLALVVSDFKYIETKTSRGTRVRVWAKKSHLANAKHALEHSAKVLEHYEKYFGVQFPFGKMDAVAMDRFEAAAMENWGLIIYRPHYLTFNPRLYSAQQKKSSEVVIQHETVHQWLGNLVTTKWWDNIFLNEGGATYGEGIGIYGGYNFSAPLFVYYGLAFDNEYARAVVKEVTANSRIMSMFDSVTYQKGACMYYMARSILGEKAFKKGINSYMKKLKYANAEHTDLFTVLNAYVNVTDWQGNKLDLNKFFKLWLLQAGHPTVQVKRHNATHVQLKQKLPRKHSEYWYVPIWYSVDGVEQPMQWLHEKAIFLEAPAEKKRLVVNGKGKGFFRVHYADALREELISQLQADPMAFSADDRARLLDDWFATLSAEANVSAALAMPNYLLRADEHHYPAWRAALDGLNSLKTGGRFHATLVDQFMRQALSRVWAQGAVFERLARSELADQPEQSALSLRVIEQMCALQESGCLQVVERMFFEQFVRPCAAQANPVASECSSVLPALRPLVYCYGAQQSDNQWQLIQQLYRSESHTLEQGRLLRALACSPKHFEKILSTDSTITPEHKEMGQKFLDETNRQKN